MKKIIILSSLLIFLVSCNFLDIVPADTPVLEDAFKDEKAADRFMYTCYSQIPNYQHFRDNPSWCTTPEYVPAYHWTTGYFKNIAILQGKYSSTNPVTDLWRQAYRGIRQCYTFLDNMDAVPNTDTSPAAFEEMKTGWRAQCNFLIAYYHYMLLQNYGPIPIVDKLMDVGATGDELFIPRSTYDVCVQRIGEMFDNAIAELPVSVSSYEYGRPTKAAAQALKARMYLYAASPLFNGNSRLYANFKSLDGVNLISQTYEKEKWKKALDETALAIRLASEAGHKLYNREGASGDEFNRAKITSRYVITDPWNIELIWGYSGNKEGYGGAGDYQRHVIPYKMADADTYGGLALGLFGVKLFHTKNGLPIDLDPEYDTDPYSLVTNTENVRTLYLNTNREPRFYAWVGFDGGEFPCNGTTKLALKAGQKNGAAVGNLSRDHAYSGYIAIKGVNPDLKLSSTQKGIVPYPFPLARLGELYLGYAEAYVEYYGKLDGDALKYVNDIRTRAGIPNFEVSYAKAIGGVPTGTALVNAIHRERTIELMYEGHMYYDYRRWMTASKEWSDMKDGPLGLNSAGQTDETFNTVIRLTNQPFVFTSKQYLLPIHQDIININRNLVQNPGWGQDILPELN